MTAIDADANAEAARRAAVVLENLERLDLTVIVLPRPDKELVDAVERARGAAEAAGRGTMLESATRSARDVAMRAFSRSGFSGTWAATEMAASVVRPDDRVAAAAAFEAAAIAAVTEDLVDVDTIEVLREPTDALRRSTGLPSPGALSNFSSPRRSPTGSLQVGLGIGIVVLGAVVVAVTASLASGLIVIAGGFALLGAVGRRRSAP